MLDARHQISRYLEGYSFDDFQNYRKTVDAVIRNFEIIGEAAKNDPETIPGNVYSVGYHNSQQEGTMPPVHSVPLTHRADHSALTGKGYPVLRPAALTGKGYPVLRPAAISGKTSMALRPAAISGKTSMALRPAAVTGKTSMALRPAAISGKTSMALRPAALTGKATPAGHFGFYCTGVSVDDPAGGVPAGYGLGSKFPNPFNPRTRAVFSTPNNGSYQVGAYDVPGRKVMDKSVELSPGTNQFRLVIHLDIGLQ